MAPREYRGKFSNDMNERTGEETVSWEEGWCGGDGQGLDVMMV